LAIQYLEKGALLKDFNALNILSQQYMEGQYVTQDTIMGKMLEKEADSILN